MTAPRNTRGSAIAHLACAAARALGYADRGDPMGALAALSSDLAKHPGTAGRLRGPLADSAIDAATSGDGQVMRLWIVLATETLASTIQAEKPTSP